MTDPAATPMMQLIYTSRPFGFDAGMLDDILISARRHNRDNGITGALICRADLFMQMLEGPRDAVTETFARILRDDRHLNIMLICSCDIDERLFPDWDMRDDPPRSWMWTRADVAAGAARVASMKDVRWIFTRLAAEPGEAPSPAA
jgi:hypothetical protein